MYRWKISKQVKKLSDKIERNTDIFLARESLPKIDGKILYGMTCLRVGNNGKFVEIRSWEEEIWYIEFGNMDGYSEDD